MKTELSARSQIKSKIDQISADVYFQLIPEITREFTKKLMDQFLETDGNDACRKFKNDNNDYGNFKSDLMNIHASVISKFIELKNLTGDLKGDDTNSIYDALTRDYKKKTNAPLASVVKAERNKELNSNYFGQRITYTELAEIFFDTGSNLKKTFGSHSENGAKAVFFNANLNSLIALENKRLYLLGLFTNFSQTYSEEEYVNFVNLCIQLDREGVLKINEGGKK